MNVKFVDEVLKLVIKYPDIEVKVLLDNEERDVLGLKVAKEHRFLINLLVTKMGFRARTSRALPNKVLLSHDLGRGAVQQDKFEEMARSRHFIVLPNQWVATTQPVEQPLAV